MIDISELDVYEIRPRKDGDGFDLISDRLRYGPIWYAGPDCVRNAVAYAKFRALSHSRKAIIRVFNHSGAIEETHYCMAGLQSTGRHRANFRGIA
jgi:hypothetical protein